jgi:penicillin-binding protein 1C
MSHILKKRRPGVILSLAITLSVGGGIFFVYLLGISRSLPPVEQLEGAIVSQSTKIFDRTGENLLYEIYDEEKRTVVPAEDIPELAKKAVIAIEDEHFYTHPAFDLKAILRALTIDLIHGRVTQGGSTITQQLARNAFLTPRRSVSRKLKELVLAYRIEKIYDKEQILALYLNQVPFGYNSYGIEAASRLYFNKSAKNLSLGEAAMLAALPQAPSYYSPWGTHADELERRRSFVLKKMRELDFIDDEQLTSALENKPGVVLIPPKANFNLAPHFIMMVQDYLNQKYGDDFVRRAGLKVTTTLDKNLQELANSTIEKWSAVNAETYNAHNAALVAEEATTGQILSLVGSKGYSLPSEPEDCLEGRTCLFEGNFNVASQGLRQPGSTLKPFIYMTAFSGGLTPDAIVFDAPTEFSSNPACPAIVDYSNDNPACYHPQDYDRLFRGPISLKNALGQSLNVPSVKVFYLAGIEKSLDILEKFGITSLKDRGRYGLSLVLGGGEIRLAELVHAYTILAQEGIKRDQTIILKIEDSSGRTLEQYEDKNERVIDAQYPRLVNDILSDREQRLPLFRYIIKTTEIPGRQVAFKTGTTDDTTDVWTFGYTPDLVVGIWAGNNNREPLQGKSAGAVVAAPIWQEFMTGALKTRPALTFTKPDPIPTDNPILRGEFDPQNSHNILYHLNRLSDPQYQNWETGVLFWLRNNPLPASIGEPLYTYASGKLPERGGSYGTIEIIVSSPKNGEFFKDAITGEALVRSSAGIGKIELYFNNRLIETKSDNLGENYSYSFSFRPTESQPQNLLVVRLTDQNGNFISKEIIVFKED